MLDQQHIKYFKNLVGGEDFFTDLAHLNAYCYDATKERHLPSGVIFPRNEQEISQILKYCNEHRIIVVPRGAGSGFTGGALSV
ncbi:FAD-binding oxidoreductase, partial [Helicobacter pylori]